MAAAPETNDLRKALAMSTVAPRPAVGTGGPKLLGRLRGALRSRHYSRRTEQTYCHWVRRFIYFHKVRHPPEISEPEINAFLTHLAVKEAVRRAQGVMRVGCHMFRRSFATHSLESDYDVPTIQGLLDHEDASTTMVYTRVLNRGAHGVSNPIDVCLVYSVCIDSERSMQEKE